MTIKKEEFLWSLVFYKELGGDEIYSNVIDCKLLKSIRENSGDVRFCQYYLRHADGLRKYASRDPSTTSPSSGQAVVENVEKVEKVKKYAGGEKKKEKIFGEINK